MASTARQTKITELIPDAKNANKGTLRGLALLDDSIREDGLGRGILVDKDGHVIAGNKTLQAAVEDGFTDVIVVPTDGHTLVATQRTDVSIDSVQGRRMGLRDNRIAQVDLDFDANVLFELQGEGVDLSALWDEDELAELLAGIDGGEPPGDPGAALSRAEEWQKKYNVQRGQVWRLDRHRIMCGDSYNAEHLALLLDGKHPDMLHTDPPYGIDIVKPRNDSSTADSGGAKPFGSTGETKRKGKNAVAFRNSVGAANSTNARGAITTANVYPVMKGDGAGRVPVQHGKPSRNQIIQSNLYPVMRGDHRAPIVPTGAPGLAANNLYPVIEGDDHPFDPVPFLDFAPIVVLWGANYYADQLPSKSGWICWDKREDITRNNFADGELAWTNQDKPMRIFHHLWNGLHKGSQHGQARLHPTEKPVALFENIGQWLSDKGLWVDLFAGSGAQLVAAQNTGATCYAMEYEPLYVATILERLSLMGLTPELSNG